MEIRDVHALLGRTAYAADGDRLGTVTGAYLDDATGRPSWMTVEHGGLFRTTRSFVPLDGVEVVDGGVRVGVDADAVKRAPHVDDDRVLTRADEQELLRHYGISREPAAPERGTDAVAADDGPVADDDSAVMTRSEEQVRVGTTTVPTSRAVLRTTRVVEERTFTVPLGRDQVQVAYEPLPDAGPAPVTAQPTAAEHAGRVADGDGEGWVVLYEERLVVRTEWVPVERVRLRTVGVRGEELVNVDLRRERIDVDVEQAGDPAPRPTVGGTS
jgi:stress response protein YsnF